MQIFDFQDVSLLRLLSLGNVPVAPAHTPRGLYVASTGLCALATYLAFVLMTAFILCSQVPVTLPQHAEKIQAPKLKEAAYILESAEHPSLSVDLLIESISNHEPNRARSDCFSAKRDATGTVFAGGRIVIPAKKISVDLRQPKVKIPASLSVLSSPDPIPNTGPEHMEIISPFAPY